MNEMEAILEKARRLQAEDQADKALRHARSRLVLTPDAAACFFASIAMRLRLTVDWAIDTMATDGERLVFNPDFVNTLGKDETMGVWAHEVMHIANQHHCRMGDRPVDQWNIATDLAVNDLLKNANVTLPKGRLLPGEPPFADLPRGLSAEDYYDRLPKQPDGDGGAGQDPGKCGGVMAPGDGSPAACREAEINAKIMTVQAATMAKGRGAMPASLTALVEQVKQARVDYKHELRRFMDTHAKNDYAWTPPSRRWAAQGLYLPSLHSDELGTVAVTVDCSGSCWDKAIMAHFSGNLGSILECLATAAYIFYHDTVVTAEEVWHPGDGPFMLSPRGGGGTCHREVFERIAQLDPTPACVICLTDLHTSFPATPPDIPVLWAVVGNSHPTAPFGEILPVRVDQ